MNTSIYWNINRALSYNALWIFIIGERGVGKTYGTKDFLISHFKKTHKKFVWLRRYQKDLLTAVGDNKNKHFYTQLSNKYDLKDFSTTVNENTYYLSYKSKIMGYATSFKQAESIKGTDFSDVDYIVVDEFLVGDGGSRYLKDEVKYILSLYETIARMRDVKVIFLGNATSVYNPYFEFFKIHLPYNSEYKTFKNGLILVNYIKNEKYREAKKQTRFGQLIEGTDYEEYAINNKFINDNDDFIAKKHQNAKLLFNINVDDDIMGVWIYKSNMYISRQSNVNNHVLITTSIYSHSEKTTLLKHKNVFITNMLNHFKVGSLYFENQTIKHKIIDMFIKNRLIS